MTLHLSPVIPIPRPKKESDKKDSLQKVMTEPRRNPRRKIGIMIVRRRITEIKIKKISIKLKKSKSKKVASAAEAVIKRRNTIDHVRKITYLYHYYVQLMKLIYISLIIWILE